jgi:polar amino acid transport system ATP-binding protein
MLKIKNVNKSFNGEQILKNINLSIEKASIVGLAGSSGSGKSTLLRCIQGLDSPDCGEIECAGKVGFMFQDFQLFPHMTVFKNVTYAQQLRAKKQAGKNKEKRHEYSEKALGLLKQLGIDDKANDYPRALSGGQKQRVALARSLIVDPDLLLCDEPTSGLDVASTQGVADLLSSVRALNVSMLIASHDLEFITMLADRVVLLRDGQIVADVEPGAHENPVQYIKQLY